MVLFHLLYSSVIDICQLCRTIFLGQRHYIVRRSNIKELPTRTIFYLRSAQNISRLKRESLVESPGAFLSNGLIAQNCHSLDLHIRLIPKLSIGLEFLAIPGEANI